MITAVSRSSPYPDQMITAVTRSRPYPDQMITAVTRSSPYPDQMMDQHLETTSTALNVSGDRTPRWAPETDLQWGPRHLDSHREKTTGTSGALILWLCCSWNKLLVHLARGENCHFTLFTHYFPILLLCSCFVTICIVKSNINKGDLTWRKGNRDDKKRI